MAGFVLYATIFGLLFWLSVSIRKDSEKLRLEQPEQEEAAAFEGDASRPEKHREPTDAELKRWKLKMGAMLLLFLAAIALMVKDCSHAVGILG